MCLTCGCMDAHLEMGEANITYEDVKRAADENGRSVAETLDIMERTKAKDREDIPMNTAHPKPSETMTPTPADRRSTHSSGRSAPERSRVDDDTAAASGAVDLFEADCGRSTLAPGGIRRKAHGACRKGVPSGIISWLVVGAIAGYLAGFLVKGDEGLGVIGHIALGIVGGLLGGFLAGLLTGGNDYITGINFTSIVVAVIGAVIAVFGYNFIRSRSGSGGGTV